MNENNTIKKLPGSTLLSMPKDVHNAVKEGRKDDVLAFISEGYDPTFMSNELILLAVELRHYDMAKLLLANGVSMSLVSCAFDVLDEAIKRNDIESCRFALEQGAGKSLVNEP